MGQPEGKTCIQVSGNYSCQRLCTESLTALNFKWCVSAESMVEIEAELFELRQQLAELQARRRLDLDLCHVRAAGMGAEIQELKSRLAVETLEEIRDRVLRRFSPIRRRLLKKALDQFISYCCQNI